MALKKLRKLNRIISIRLALYESIPSTFRTYHVHDGRVTFVVPEEFELDLSVAEEDKSSQFFFVDIRFLFTPSVRIPKGRVFDEFDLKVNNALRDGGLGGCFTFLHNLVVTDKINILFKQAVELATTLWAGALHVELIRRTLVLQYWTTSRQDHKSWLEIGIKSGRQNSKLSHGIPCLALRWMRDGQEVDCESVLFNTGALSLESILRSVIGLHISHILSTAYAKLSEMRLFAGHTFCLHAELSRVEPGDCHLDVQLTASRSVRVSIEPMSGIWILSGTQTAAERSESERSNVEKPPADDLVLRVSRVRCMAAMEEIETNVNVLGLETVNARELKFDARRVFAHNILRFSFFQHRYWNCNWFAVATSSMDGDHWWAIKLGSGGSVSEANDPRATVVEYAQVISGSFLTSRRRLDYSLFSDLGHCLSGMVAVHANARFLAELQSILFSPSLEGLQLEASLKVPGIFLRYQPGKLPLSLQMTVPTGFKKRSFAKETIRLAFAGVDPSNEKLAVMVAYGRLRVPGKALPVLDSKVDDSLVIRPTGSDFAIRLVAPAGQPVVVDLFEQLQKLECALSILETLRRKRMDVRNFSLSRITFAYGPETALSACINVEVLRPRHPSHQNGDDDPLSRASSTFRLRLGFYFERPNPHCRFQESITRVLNDSYPELSLESALDLLAVTLPLFQAFDRVTANQSREETLRMQVTVRNFRAFVISYPMQKCRMTLTLGRYPNCLGWVLKDASDPSARPKSGQVVARLRQMVYNTRGDGWKGLGNGAVANVKGVGSLISKLDECLLDCGERFGCSNS